MVGDPPNGTIGYRLGSIERRLDRIDLLEPAVMRAELVDVKDDIRQITRDLAGLRRILIGFIVSFAISTATLVAVILTSASSSP